MNQRSSSKEQIIKNIVEEVNEMQQYIDNIEQEIFEIKKRINEKQEYLKKMYDIYNINN